MALSQISDVDFKLHCYFSTRNNSVFGYMISINIHAFSISFYMEIHGKYICTWNSERRVCRCVTDILKMCMKMFNAGKNNF